MQGHNSEWALLQRHESENIFGVQLCGNSPEIMARTAEVINKNLEVDFVDINVCRHVLTLTDVLQSGCPIDLIYQSGAGSALMAQKRKMREIVSGMARVRLLARSHNTECHSGCACHCQDPHWHSGQQTHRPQAHS
jgi:tRNA-dihydrouridine synthase 3